MYMQSKTAEAGLFGCKRYFGSGKKGAFSMLVTQNSNWVPFIIFVLVSYVSNKLDKEAMTSEPSRFTFKVRLGNSSWITIEYRLPYVCLSFGTSRQDKEVTLGELHHLTLEVRISPDWVGFRFSCFSDSHRLVAVVCLVPFLFYWLSAFKRNLDIEGFYLEKARKPFTREASTSSANKTMRLLGNQSPRFFQSIRNGLDRS